MVDSSLKARIGEAIHRSIGLIVHTRTGARDEPTEHTERAPPALQSLSETSAACSPAPSNPPFPLGARSKTPTAAELALAARDVSPSLSARFLADPFVIPDGDGGLHLFMEVMPRGPSPTGRIGHAYSEDLGLTWAFTGEVLAPGYHISYPQVWRHKDEYYMLPEDGREPGSAELTLYRADPFPSDWRPVRTLVQTEHGTADHALFRYRDRWWLVVGNDEEARMDVYHSPSLETGLWEEHDQNPVVINRPQGYRPAGRPVVQRDSILLFLQATAPEYGTAVRGFEITDLSETTYKDRPLKPDPFLAGTGRWAWNGGRIHHVDPLYLGEEHGWLLFIDGDVPSPLRIGGSHWAIGRVRCPGRQSKSPM